MLTWLVLALVLVVVSVVVSLSVRQVVVRSRSLPDWLSKIIQSGAVWAALIGLANVLIKYFLPDFPPEIVAAVNTLLVVILAAVGISVSQRMQVAPQHVPEVEDLPSRWTRR